MSKTSAFSTKRVSPLAEMMSPLYGTDKVIGRFSDFSELLVVVSPLAEVMSPLYGTDKVIGRFSDFSELLVVACGFSFGDSDIAGIGGGGISFAISIKGFGLLSGGAGIHVVFI
jgi:hypothetical protein